MDAIRRYTSPTCTLELLARTSPLSRWTGRPVLTNMMFRLSFDGPHRSRDRQLSVQGHQDQLESVVEMVHRYVQQVLTRSLQQFTHQLQPASEASLSPTTLLTGDGTTPERLPAEWAQPPSQRPVVSLRPLTRLKHQLQVSLGPQPLSIDLSTVELLDLADALDAYEREGIVAAPAAARKPPGWIGAAAAAVLVVGLTGTIVQVTRFTTTETAQDLAQQTEGLDQGGDATAPEAYGDGAAAEDEVAIADIPAAPDPVNNPQQTAPAASPEARTVNPGAANPRASEAPPPASPNQPATQPPSSSPAAGPAPSGEEAIPPELAAIPPIDTSGAESTRQRQAGDAPPPNAALSDRALSRPEAMTRGPAPVSPSAIARQVQAAVQSRWQPPNDLRQSLEYRVTVGPDGTLQRVRPIGDTARAYLPEIAALQVGEAVSPPSASGSGPIRLVLRQDGQVRAFME